MRQKPAFPSHLPRLGCYLVTFANLAILPSHAGTVTYLGSGTLSTNASWDTGARPTTTDEARFTGTLAETVTTAAGTNLEFGNFIWNSNNSSTVALNTTGASATQLRLTSGGGSTAAIANGGAAGDLLVLGANATSNTLTISGNLGVGTAQLEVFLQANGNINVVNSGATLDIATRLRERNGSFGFTKTGAGTLILRGSNTYTGNTTLQEGTLGLRNSNALSSGALTINGGTLASMVSPRTISNNVTVGGNFTLGGFSQGLTLNGTMDLGGAVRSITLDNSATIGGIISNGGLSKSGNSTLTLSAANTYAGNTTVSAGTLLVTNTSDSGTGTGSVTVKSGATLGGGAGATGGRITGATLIENGGVHTAGTSVTSNNTTATIGIQTFETGGVTYNEGSIFEWNLTASGETEGTRGSDYDGVKATTFATTGGEAIFRVVLNGSQDFSEAFWDTDRTWSDVFTNTAGASQSLAEIFQTVVQTYNSAGALADISSQGSFTITGSNLNWTFSAVPEPTGSLAALLIGAGLLRRSRPTRSTQA